ncbi:MAG: DUF4926 domain-containing protein [SAR324 cluster bacterium]|nr:DUF4926 domain-containing protein [SAR324 cluster bacterium]
MKFALFTRVALRVNIPQYNLCQGDVATIVEYHQGHENQEPGYSLEVFNALGKTIAIFTAPESHIEPLGAHEVLHVRPLKDSSLLTQLTS